jgi:OmpA-OmpF porin, OOP family
MHVVILVALGMPFTIVAQVPLSTKSQKAIELYQQADNYRVRGQYMEAIRLLNQAIDKDKNFAEAYYRLGLVYMSMKNYPLAITNFEQGLALTSDVRKQKVYWYDLGEACLITAQYEQAVKYLSDFIRVENQNRQKAAQAEQFLASAQFALEHAAVNAAYRLRPLSDTVNRFALQYFPVLTADQQQLIFTRRLGNGAEHDEDLVISHKDARGQWTAPESISSAINSSLNEGTCTISADGRKLIFTSCVGRQGFGSCDLFESQKIGGEWTVPVNLGPNVNSAEWESQPALSADGRTLYFVSDRRGGLGRRDIWVSTLDESGNWRKAVNLGPPVNTVYDEISPFIHANGRRLYFASKGHTGFGGYDIFFSEKGTSNWTAPVNAGRPINDHEDQFALFITADGERAYFSHEETSDKSSRSRIYEVQIPEGERITFRSNYVSGVVTDKKTSRPLKARIELVNLSTNEIESMVMSDSITGQYLMVLTQGAEYALYTNARGYLFNSANFNYTRVDHFEPVIMNLQLEPVSKGSSVVLNNIFFETDKYDLQEKSLTELQKVVRFLNENPGVSIEISGHTDTVGQPAYNQQLSEKRAQSVYQYLISQQIGASRLSWKGYGSSRPKVSNDTEAGRQQNRRIEFLIR